MKTIYTLLLILMALSGIYAQKATSPNQKTGIQPTEMASGGELFSINKVYPNPAKDFLTIELQSEVSGTMQVSIINILGVEVKRWDYLNLSPGEQKVKIDLTSIKSGVYFLRLTRGDEVKTQVLKKI